MTDHRVTLDFNRPFRLFPLPACVLLPHATAPLHVFEDRYRGMLNQALDSDGLIAMAVTDAADTSMLVDPENPPLRSTVTVGYVVHHDALDDGRYNILLQGLCRARIVDELDPDPAGFRRAMLRPVGHRRDEASDQALETVRERVTGLLSRPGLAESQKVQALQTLLTNADVSTAAFLDLAGMVLSRDSDERYALLAEADAVQRGQQVVHQLQVMQEDIEQSRSLGDPRRDPDDRPADFD